MDEPLWIYTKASALAIHDRQLSEHGGCEGVRDDSLLESALDRPKNCFYYSQKSESIPKLAARSAYSIIKSHPFIDGNKRTALVAAITFLRRHNYDLLASQEDKYHAIINLASGEWDEEALAAWFKENSKKVSE